MGKSSTEISSARPSVKCISLQELNVIEKIKKDVNKRYVLIEIICVLKICAQRLMPSKEAEVPPT